MSFIRSFVRSFVRPSMRSSFVHSFVRSHILTHFSTFSHLSPHLFTCFLHRDEEDCAVPGRLSLHHTHAVHADGSSRNDELRDGQPPGHATGSGAPAARPPT